MIKMSNFQVIQVIQNMLLSAIKVSKQQYYSWISKKLMDSGTKHKTDCSLLKTFLINKKTPSISLLLHNNKFVSNFREKAALFKKIFVQQYTLIDNASEIPATLNIKTTKTLSSIQVTRAEFAKLIEDLGPNKAHGYNMISIRILKSCGDSVLPPLQLIFKSYLEIGTFSSE